LKKGFLHLNLFDETGLESETIKSLKLIILGVAFGTTSFNITGGIAMTGYLESLGTSDFMFGVLFAIGPLMAPMQIVASFILERTRKRKFLFLLSGIIQRTVWLPFGLVPFFIPMDRPMLRIWMALIFLLISAVFAPFINISFNSLAADIVPMNIRGSYFAVRSRMATMFGVAGGILTAWFLDSFSGFASYAFVFTLAAIMGTLDILCFIGVKFPPMAKHEHSEKFRQNTKSKGSLKNKGIQYVWGIAHKLEIIEKHGRAKIIQQNGILTMQVPPGTSKAEMQQILDKWYHRQLQEAAPELVNKWEKITGIKIKKIFYRKMKTHWGSCNTKKHTIRLNTELAKKPQVCLDYVIIHEILHVHEVHHNERYYKLMNKYFPDWKELKKKMNKGEI